MDKNILLNITKFKNKLKRDPHQKVHALLADNYRRVGLTEDAIDTCTTGLELFPSYLLCCEVLGRILLRLGRIDEAKEQLEKVHSVVKDNVELNRALAKAYLELKDTDAARPLLESVLAKDPFDFEMRNLLTSLDRSQTATWDRDEDGEGGESSGIDLFDDTRPRPRKFDLETILAQTEDVGPVAPLAARTSATDTMLDGLEHAEGTIESSAEQMIASLAEDTDPQQPRMVRSERRDIYIGKENELRGAAVLAQMHMEIQLLEEALNILTKLHENDEDDELEDLSLRLQDALDRKEEGLDRLEESELARGL